MADNFLEKRMDDYRSGRLSTPRGGRSASCPTLDGRSLVLEYPKLSVLLMARDGSPLTVPLLRALRSVGLSVAFSIADSAEGTRLSQSLGGRFYPASFDMDRILADIHRHWGDLYRVISLDSAPIPGSLKVDASSLQDVDLDDLARFILFSIHPANAFSLDYCKFMTEIH